MPLNPHCTLIANGEIPDSLQVDFRKPEDFFHDVNSVTSVLKSFFRELPDPLLTNALYYEFINASRMFSVIKNFNSAQLIILPLGIEDDIIRRDTLHGIINRLPDPNYATFRALTLVNITFLVDALLCSY